MGAFLAILFWLALMALFVYVFVKYRQIVNRSKVGDDMVYRRYCNALNNSEMHNLIISGGKALDRFQAITSILNEAYSQRIPTIVLHSGFAPFNHFTQDTYFDPCIGTDSDEIAEFLTDAAANAMNIDSVVHSSIKFMVDVLKAVNENITLADVVKFPCDDVISLLDDYKEREQITSSQYDKFKQRYNNPAIRDNILRVVPLLSKLKPLTQRSGTAQPINLQQAVTERRILFFDLLTDSNAVLKELVFSAINKLTEVSKFWVITEGISFMGKAESKVDTVFTKNRNNITLVYSGDDVPALTSQTEQTFNTLTGSNSQLLLFAHTAGSSAIRWSEHFGEEFQSKEMETRSRGVFNPLNRQKGGQKGAEKAFRFPPQHFQHIAKTTDINNRQVTWGLNEGECYFIDENNTMLESQKPKPRGIIEHLIYFAMKSPVPDGRTEYSLPKIALQYIPLQITVGQ